MGLAPWLRPWWRERGLRRAPRPASVLLITLDTTRADHLGCYGRAGDPTPNLDALASHGVTFRQAYSHVPLTFPSHTSMLTGRLPTHHGVRDNGGFVLGADVPTLAERFAAAGHRTGAFVSAFVLDHRFGLARGFATYHDRVPPPLAADQGDPSGRSVRAAETVDRALSWLGAEPARPFFLWVHLFDPHHPYEPPEPFATRYAQDPYAGEIAYMDAELGRLLKAVADRGGPPILVAVMGDHGEGLGDHEEMTHGYFIYGNTQHVPLLLSLPGALPEGLSIEGLARGVDLAPTLLELAGLPSLPQADGTSLVPSLTSRRTGDAGPVYLESYQPRFWWGAQELLGLRSGRWLFVEAPRPELYDVAADPGERSNLAALRPAELESLRQRLRALAAGGAPGPGPRMDPETERNLEALGYLGASAAATEGPLPDPKDNGPLLGLVTRGHDLATRGRGDEALAAFQQALALNPRAASVRMRVAETLLQLGRPEEAFRTFAETAQGRSGEQQLLGMSQARERQGRHKEALELAEAGLEQFPDSGRLLVQAGRLQLQGGEAKAAAALLRRALEAFPGDPSARLALANALTAQGRAQEAAESLLTLAEESPESAEARGAAPRLLEWGDRALNEAQLETARRCYEAALGAGQASEAIFLNLALTHWRLARREEALGVLQRGLAKFPASAELHYRAGRVLEGLGRRDEAEGAYRRALALGRAR